MKERPILFSTEMVEAILEGRKTQTRRILKPQLPYHKFDFCGDNEGGYSALTPKGYLEFRGYGIDGNGNREYAPFAIKPKHGEKNDILWVRETWATGKHGTDGTEYLYKAGSDDYFQDKWKPSIHMPKEACRLRLKIKSIRIERLQEISEQDAIAEGIELIGNRYKQYLQTRLDKTVENPIYSYMTLWESINGIGSWEKNLYVWVIEFERA